MPLPSPDRMLDGLQSLRDHNLISYKSMNEAFDHHALNELIGHAMAYAKLQAGEDWRTFSESLGLIALSTRKPSSEVISRLLHQTKDEDVYEIDCSWNVTCLVINLAPPKDRNWLWELLRGERTRWKRGSISAILKTIEQRLKKMGTLDPEIEAFETEIIEYWLRELPPEKRFLGLDLEIPV